MVRCADLGRLYRAGLDVNLWGAIAVTQAFSPLEIAAGRGGSIVNISSVAGCIPTPWSSVYSASKAALTLVGEALRLEMAPFGIKVVTVVTGTVGSRLLLNAPEVRLPPTSPYLAVEKNVIARRTGEDTGRGMKAKKYVAKAVNDVLGGANGLTYRGTWASMAGYITIYVSSSWFVNLFCEKSFRVAGALNR